MTAWWLLAPTSALGLVLAAARAGSRADTPPPDDGRDAAQRSGLFPALDAEETQQ